MVELSGIPGDTFTLEYMYDGTDFTAFAHLERNSQEFLDGSDVKFEIFDIAGGPVNSVTLVSGINIGNESFYFEIPNVGPSFIDGNLYIASLSINISGDTYTSVSFLDLNIERNMEVVGTSQQANQLVTGLGI